MGHGHDATNAQAFTDACSPYAGMVYRHCLHMLRNAHDAEDAAQDAMLRAFRAYGDFRGQGVATWLYRIAHNTCLDVLKSARYKRESVTLEARREDGFDPPDEGATPEERYMADEENAALWRAVATLPEDQQTLLTLFYGEGRSYAELAEATGLREGTVKSKLNRAKAALRQRLQAG